MTRCEWSKHNNAPSTITNLRFGMLMSFSKELYLTQLDIMAIIKRLKREFTVENGYMDKAGFRWIQQILRHECRSNIKQTLHGDDFSLSIEKTQTPYYPPAYDTIGDFLEEPTGDLVATFSSGQSTTYETWEDRYMEVYNNALMDWLKMYNLHAKLLSHDGFIDERFWDALIEESLSDLDWLERFRKLKFSMFTLQLVQM